MVLVSTGILYEPVIPHLVLEPHRVHEIGASHDMIKKVQSSTFCKNSTRNNPHVQLQEDNGSVA